MVTAAQADSSPSCSISSAMLWMDFNITQHSSTTHYKNSATVMAAKSCTSRIFVAEWGYLSV